MEAATLTKKKTISKGKLKKTIKNVLCRPDLVFWPLVIEEQEKSLKNALIKYKISIAEYKKPHWKEVQLIPRERRPKPPKIKKVDGLLFGILDCCNALKNRECSAVIIESTVNPRSIVQHVIEACIAAQVSIVCLNGLRQLTTTNFGIPTCCLGVKTDNLKDLTNTILEIAKCYKPQISNKPAKMDVDEECITKKESNVENNLSFQCPYLFRTNKKTRVFIPSETKGINNAFTGQDFIELPKKQTQKLPDSKAYMNMIVKRITNNPNRLKSNKQL